MSSDTVSITILVDNHSKEGFLEEHGLSLWVEADGQKILFDTAQSNAWYHNAKTLGIDPDTTDMLVLSHGHYDHTGGVPAILRNGHPIHVYAHPGVVTPRYSIRDNMAAPIHMPRESMRCLDKVKDGQMHWIYTAVNLTGRVGVTGPIPRETEFEDTGGPFYLDPEGHRPDSLEDDLSLWVKTDKGLVIVTGCCHSGLVNTMRYILELNPGLNIHAVIGGFHLVTAGRERLNLTIEALEYLGVKHVIPLHCTGDMAIDALINALGDRVAPGMAGQTYRF